MTHETDNMVVSLFSIRWSCIEKKYGIDVLSVLSDIITRIQ